MRSLESIKESRRLQALVQHFERALRIHQHNDMDVTLTVPIEQALKKAKQEVLEHESFSTVDMK